MRINDTKNCTGLHFNEGQFRFKHLPVILINCHGFKYYFYWLKLRKYRLDPPQSKELSK